MREGRMILPGATLGLIGGGQLGAMFAAAARRMGYRVLCLDPDPQAPAAGLAHDFIAAAYNDAQALARLARECAAVTTKFENVPAASLERLARCVPVRPSALALAVAQDRAREKTFLNDIGLPTARFGIVEHAAALPAALARTGLPAILKTSRHGYDGKGQRRVASLEAAQRAFAEMGGVTCVVEEQVALERELSVVLARGADGELRDYAATENRHRDGILDLSLAPARIHPATARQAAALAIRLAERLDYCGVLAVEFFLTRERRLLVNEFAPRPHNSGHWTLDAAATSQFEQQVRALCGLPLGDAALLRPAAMGNLLGDLWRDGRPPAWERLLAQPRAKLHLYGKAQPRPGRKMGHFTCLAETAEAALEEAEQVRRALDASPAPAVAQRAQA